MLADGRARRRRRSGRRAGEPRHDRPLRRGRRRRRRRRHAGHRRRDQPEGRAGVGRGPVQRPGRDRDARRGGVGGLRLIGSSSHRGTSHTDADWSGRIAIVVGNEAAGLDARRRRSTSGCASSTAAGPRASTWRWRRRCCASRRSASARRRAADIGSEPAGAGPASAAAGRAALLEWLASASRSSPLVVAVVRAASSDWMPVGDAAYFTVRSRTCSRRTIRCSVPGRRVPRSSACRSTTSGRCSSTSWRRSPSWRPYLGTAIGSALINAASVVAVWVVGPAAVPARRSSSRDGRHDAVRRHARAVVADRRPPAERPGAAVVRPAVAERSDVGRRRPRRPARCRLRQPDRADALHVRVPAAIVLAGGVVGFIAVTWRLATGWRPVAIVVASSSAPVLAPAAGRSVRRDAATWRPCSARRATGPAPALRPACRSSPGPRSSHRSGCRARCARSCSRTTASRCSARSWPSSLWLFARRVVIALRVRARANGPCGRRSRERRRSRRRRSSPRRGSLSRRSASCRRTTTGCGRWPPSSRSPSVAGVGSLPAGASTLRRGSGGTGAGRARGRRARVVGASPSGRATRSPLWPYDEVEAPTCRAPAACPARRRHRRRRRRRPRRGRPVAGVLRQRLPVRDARRAAERRDRVPLRARTAATSTASESRAAPRPAATNGCCSSPGRSRRSPPGASSSPRSPASPTPSWPSTPTLQQHFGDLLRGGAIDIDGDALDARRRGTATEELRAVLDDAGTRRRPGWPGTSTGGDDRSSSPFPPTNGPRSIAGSSSNSARRPITRRSSSRNRVRRRRDVLISSPIVTWQPAGDFPAPGDSGDGDDEPTRRSSSSSGDLVY